MEKLGAKDREGDWSQLEGTGEMLRSKLERNGTAPKAMERCPSSSVEEAGAEA